MLKINNKNVIKLNDSWYTSLNLKKNVIEYITEIFSNLWVVYYIKSILLH